MDDLEAAVSFSEAALCVAIVRKSFYTDIMGDLSTIDEVIDLERFFTDEEKKVIRKLIGEK